MYLGVLFHVTTYNIIVNTTITLQNSAYLKKKQIANLANF
jgi:hypothetical protein